MATAIFDKRFDVAETEDSEFVLRHEDGREWSSDEIRLVKEAFDGVNHTLRRYIDHIDRDLMTQADTVRELQTCVAILQNARRLSESTGSIK